MAAPWLKRKRPHAACIAFTRFSSSSHRPYVFDRRARSALHQERESDHRLQWPAVGPEFKLAQESQNFPSLSLRRRTGLPGQGPGVLRPQLSWAASPALFRPTCTSVLHRPARPSSTALHRQASASFFLPPLPPSRCCSALAPRLGTPLPSQQVPPEARGTPRRGPCTRLGRTRPARPRPGPRCDAPTPSPVSAQALPPVTGRQASPGAAFAIPTRASTSDTCSLQHRLQPSPALLLRLCTLPNRANATTEGLQRTCLSKGRGFHFPPCHILDLSGFRILLECPIDLSALTVFDPLLTADVAVIDIGDEEEGIHEGNSHQKKKRWAEREAEGGKGTPLSKNDLINAVPWYKTVGSLNLWDISLIDVVVISSPMGMLGLPFLTRNSNFSAKIYATEVTAKIGQLMMEDLVSMHSESRQFYGVEEEFGGPEWMKWKELENLPQVMREIIMGKAGEDLGSWLPLYGMAEIDECMTKVQAIKYAEESCYNSTLILKAFSSGMEIGAANWIMICPGRSVTYLSSSVLDPATAMGFDYHSLEGNDVILFSDFSSLPGILDYSNDAVLMNSQKELFDEDPSVSGATIVREDYDNDVGAVNCLADNIETSSELEKLDFICSCAIDTVRGGGSVLIPIGRLGIILQLLEKISEFLESSKLKVPIYMISYAAEGTLAFTNVMPEWLCQERQEKLYSGLPLFGHEELIKEKRLQLFPVINSSMLMKPAALFLEDFIHRRLWSSEQSSQQLDLNHKVQPLLQILKPKIVLFPEDLRAYVPHKKDPSVSFLYYSENKMLSVPSLSDDLEAFLPVELSQSQEIMDVSRFKGKLQVCSGKFLLVPTKAPGGLAYKQLHWGSVDAGKLLLSLEEKGIKGSLNKDGTVANSDDVHCIVVVEPDRAVIELSPNKILITSLDGCLADLIYEVFSSVCDGV
ncbi:hypothetical protein Taro_048409 [Colocasia esculenta]|uniref:Beta-Casp domain-containing protein n=1 Tax=Colocasia esculenta TaxID=4460 RepID=A0A843X6G9_COLES|nr:hypothetical protein [Colocasia esculenta]